MQCPLCALDCPPDATVCPRCNTDLVESPAYQAAVPGAPWQSPAPAPRPAPLPYRRRLPVPPWLLVGAVALLTVAVGTGIGLATRTPANPPAPPPTGSSTGSSTAPSPSPAAASSGPDLAAARRQAIAMDTLLASSKASRGKLGDALNGVDQCQNLPGAAAVLDQVASERDSELRQVQALALDALQDGAQLSELLTQALNYSIQADRSYAAWARALNGNCAPPAAHDGNWQNADAASQQATDAKRRFLAYWNPVAGANGLPVRPDSDL